ncbi:MAG: hypothetical protein P8N26_05710 [Cyclobacteriaceae bacterium]|nr:hypothetical protein [Cyclobacteriaceae bacterium]
MKILQIKIIKTLFFVGSCAALLIFTNCGSDDGDGGEVTLSAAEANALLLDKDWSLSSATNAGTPRDEWTGFTLKFDLDTDLAGGSYTASGIPSDEGANLVWSTSGTFTANNDLTALTRNDGIVMTLVISETALNVSFTVPESSGRVDGFTGAWVFKMVP